MEYVRSGTFFSCVGIISVEIRTENEDMYCNVNVSLIRSLRKVLFSEFVAIHSGGTFGILSLDLC